jgi:DNA-binding NarL/FixJ family response regulator
MLTAETRRSVLATCLEAGAVGWLGKDTFLDDVVSALDDVLDGTPLIGRGAREALIDELRIERAGQRRALSPFEQLTQRERDVLAALVEGMSAEEIADTQFVALATVRSQIRAVLRKLGVRSQLAAVAQANRVGWAPSSRHLEAV